MGHFQIILIIRSTIRRLVIVIIISSSANGLGFRRRRRQKKMTTVDTNSPLELCGDHHTDRISQSLSRFIAGGGQVSDDQRTTNGRRLDGKEIGISNWHPMDRRRSTDNFPFPVTMCTLIALTISQPTNHLISILRFASPPRLGHLHCQCEEGIRGNYQRIRKLILELQMKSRARSRPTTVH